MQTWQNDFLKEFERLGEEEVRRCHLATQYGSPGSEKYAFVETWLRSREMARAEVREEAMLKTAREANSIASKARSEARRANTIAISAAIIATMSMITTIIIAVLKWTSNP